MGSIHMQGSPDKGGCSVLYDAEAISKVLSESGSMCALEYTTVSKGIRN